MVDLGKVSFGQSRLLTIVSSAEAARNLLKCI